MILLLDFWVGGGFKDFWGSFYLWENDPIFDGASAYVWSKGWFKRSIESSTEKSKAPTDATHGAHL